MQLSTRWDGVFDRFAGSVPVPFLRALAWKESTHNPSQASGPAWGLLQIVEVVRESYNSRFGTAYARPDLLNPNVNTKIGTDLLRRIADSYERFHDDPNMQTDWSNPEFVKLVLAGWNSGYSEAGGVGKVADYLEKRNIPVTHDNVFAYAVAAGATRHLSNAGKQQWQREVADLYFAQPDSARFSPMTKLAIGGTIAAVTGLLAARYVFK